MSLDTVGMWLQEPVGLASEAKVATVFVDCALGAIPPVSGAYGLHAVMDDSLMILTSRAGTIALCCASKAASSTG